ncbi:MAG TPA: hypothetical protein VI094_22855, partial [Propionibacteriaceae bacterium]
LALATAIIGAAVSANLILLILDISWDRSHRSRFLVGAEASAPTYVIHEDAPAGTTAGSR